MSACSTAAADTVRYDYSLGNVGTSTWVQLKSALADNVREVEIFDSSGQTMELGYGPVGSERRCLLIRPGGNDHPLPCKLDRTMRIVVRAVSGTATVGELSINFYY